MRLGILVNVINSSESGQTTYRIAAEAAHRGHEVWITTAGNLTCDMDDRIVAHARTVPPGKYTSAETFLATLNSPKAISQWITIDDMDVLLLRNNPSAQRPWAQNAGIHFGRIAMRHGVIVLSDPDGLTKAANKLYLNTYPREIRPRTLITRSTDRIVAMLKEEKTIILKPLFGYGGKGVFIVHRDDIDNLKQIISSISRDGFIIAQEYLPAAAEGDTRLFLLNGEPLVHRGQYAAFRRVRTGDDVRSNIHAGGRIRRAGINDTVLHLAEVVRPRLVEDGMFLVGLDIAGDKLMEINVFSPGGLGSAQKFTKVDFTDAVVDAVERKVQYMQFYRRHFNNAEMCTL
ncbi:MAG: glutathione synthetase [Pirellulales bacterium]